MCPCAVHCLDDSSAASDFLSCLDDAGTPFSQVLLHVLVIMVGILLAGLTLLWFVIWGNLLGLTGRNGDTDQFASKSEPEKMFLFGASFVPGALVFFSGCLLAGLSQHVTDSWADSCAKSSGLSPDDYIYKDAGAMYATYFSTQVVVHSFSAKTGITSMPAALIFAALVIGLVVRFKRSPIQDTVQEKSSLDSLTLANEEGAE